MDPGGCGALFQKTRLIGHQAIINYSPYAATEPSSSPNTPRS